MIFYRPTDGDPYTSPISYRPRTCFLMTQLGSPSDEVLEIRQRLEEILSEFDIKLIDANSVVTGKDFLLKIWNLLLAVPLGIAIIDESMRPGTLCNIFYELGVLQAYGKESLVIKTESATIPSDFVRTEYVKYDVNFDEKMRKFLNGFLKQADYYETVAGQVEKNPLLSVDFLRRAYLISGKEELRGKVEELMSAVALIDRARNSVETLLANF
jgi:hypothetical protein